jgi:hypothetical protein
VPHGPFECGSMSKSKLVGTRVFFLSNILHLSDGLGQCSGVLPNLSLCSYTIWRLLFQKQNAGGDFHAVLGSRMGPKLLIFYARGIFDF